LTMCASDEMYGQHVTEQPLIFMCVTILVFVFAALMFKLYDSVNEHRSKKTLNLAAQSAAVVANLFPPIIRDRLFRFNKEEEDKIRRTRHENARMPVQKFLGVDEDQPEDLRDDNHGVDTDHAAPIAELFSATTVSKSSLPSFGGRCLNLLANLLSST